MPLLDDAAKSLHRSACLLISAAGGCTVCLLHCFGISATSHTAAVERPVRTSQWLSSKRLSSYSIGDVRSTGSAAPHARTLADPDLPVCLPRSRCKIKHGVPTWKNEYGPGRLRSYKGTAGGLAIQFAAAGDKETAADTSALSGEPR